MRINQKSARVAFGFVKALCLFLFVPFLMGMNEGITPLMRASKSGSNEEVKALIDQKVDLNAKSRYGWTALMFAAWQGHEGVVKQLLNAGADPNVVSKDVPSNFATVMGHPPRSALEEAIRNRHFDVAELLLGGGADPNPGAVALAAQTGNTPLLERMLNMGANVNASSDNAFYATPLCSAAEQGNLGMVRWLVEHGAAVNLVAVRQTPLRKAVESHDPAVVAYLLDQGANPNQILEPSDGTVLFEAAILHIGNRRHDKNLEIIQLLLERGADPSIAPYDGDRSVLEYVKGHRASTLKYLNEINDTRARKKLEAALDHKDEIIRLLEKHKRH